MDRFSDQAHDSLRRPNLRERNDDLRGMAPMNLSVKGRMSDSRKHRWAHGRPIDGQRVYRVVVFTLVATAVLACSNEMPTTPGSRNLSLPRIKPEMKSLPAVITSLSSAPGGSILLANYPYPERVLAELRVDGTISMTSHANAWYSSHNGPLDARGIFAGGVHYGCYMQVTIGGHGPRCSSRDAVGSQAPWVDTALVTGNVSATRGYGVPWLNPSCSSSGDPCHTYSGLQAITLNPLPAEFRTVLTGAPFRTIPPNSGTSVYWSSTVTPSSAHGIAMPLRMISRVWVKADPADSTGSPASPNCSGFACGAWVTQAGTLIETARANGVVHVDSTEVFCADSIPYLNHVAVRKGLRAALDSSGYPNDNPLVRAERYFFIVQDTVTPGATPYVLIRPKRPTADPCFAREPYPFSDRPAGTKLLAWGHTHPSEGEYVVCTLSDGTFENLNGVPIAEKIDIGVSRGDWQTSQNFNEPGHPDYKGPQYGPLYQLVVTPSTLFFIKPWQQLPNAPNLLNGNRPRLKTGKCAWPNFS